MVDANSEFLTRKINYGEKFSDILDCSLGIARRANESLYNMITLREQLNKTPKRTGRLGYKANPDYKNIESKIDRHFRNLRVCAEEEVREFNRINNEDIAIESFNATQHSFDCTLLSESYEYFSSGIHLLPSKPPITKTRVELDKTVNLEPSGYFNSLLNIEGLMPSNLDVSISPQEGKTVITTGDLKEKKIEELLKYADLKIVLKENAPNPSLESNVIFNSWGMNQEIEIFYRTDKTSITEKDRNWIREVVNKVVGSDLPKPV